MQLFNVCVVCKSTTNALIKFVIGSMVAAEQNCTLCNFSRVWRSQPYGGFFPAGNIQMSCAILFSGSLVPKILRMFSIFNIAHICARTFSRHQTTYLFPAVSSFWVEQQNIMIDNIRPSTSGLVLGGNGRANSPGHSAKYGSYCMIDLKTNKVLDIV